METIASGTDREIAALKLRISEIFYSIQGEGLRAGMPCVFIRTHGCKLRCSYCDTKYAIDHHRGGLEMTAEEVIEKVRSFGCGFVEFTGGEPLEQQHSPALMKYFCDEGYTVAVETGGHIDTGELDERVIRIIDMKAPGSKMVTLNNYRNLEILRPQDEVKFVLSDRADYEWAKDLIARHELTKRTAAVLMSCVFGKLPFRSLAEWILEDRLDVRMQLQMHKFIWDPDARGV